MNAFCWIFGMGEGAPVLWSWVKISGGALDKLCNHQARIADGHVS
jgi:hypothetical protein